MRTVRFVGLRELDGKLARLAAEVQNRAIDRSLYAGALVMEAEAKVQVEQFGAVETGFLLNSIYATSKIGSTYSDAASAAQGKADRGMEGEFTVKRRQAATVAGAEYALYVEYGWTRGSAHVAGRPYMRTAADTKQGDALRAIDRQLDAELRRLGL